MPRAALLFCLSLSAASISSPEYFMPSHRLTGLGVARHEMSPALLNERIKLMQDSQTFFFLREPMAVIGAERIESPKLAKVFEDASRKSGIPAMVIKAIAYLESFGDPLAQSPAGPRGIMQISGPTAKDMGLRMIYSTKYRVTSERKAVKGRRGKITYRTVSRKTSYQVLLRDERLFPEIAIPAAANYLARIERNFGGLDWAIFAYHCGVGCVGNMQALTERSQGMGKPLTVAKMFFGSSPILNKELHEAIQREMERDWSPTYWFRVMRAQQLLQLYRDDKPTFLEMAGYYRDQVDSAQRAQHRLAVWLKTSDLLFQNAEEVRVDPGKRLARILEDPAFFGFQVNRDLIGSFDSNSRDAYLRATPSALGTLVYIAFETRRLHAAMRPKGEKFVPLEVTSLVRSMDTVGRGGSGTGPSEALSHLSGQVFDVRYDTLPPGEKEALKFILDDMGYEGHLGFIDETPHSGTMHIGCSPSSREFFAQIYQEALGAKVN